VVDGPIDTPTCLAAVAQVLGPTLRAGDVVVVDHLAVHQQPAIHAALATVGARLRCLPPYSPDLNPIEQAVGQAETTKRRARGDNGNAETAENAERDQREGGGRPAASHPSRRDLCGLCGLRVAVCSLNPRHCGYHEARPL
jgi:DDE superfamily endonuclease